LKTNRDAWVYGSTQDVDRRNVARMVEFVNAQVRDFRATVKGGESRTELIARARSFANKDPRKHSWEAGDFQRMAAGQEIEVPESAYRRAFYRPFFPQHV